MSKVQVMDHPLIQHKVNYIRRKEVGSKEFREIVGEIAALMCYEATRDLKMCIRDRDGYIGYVKKNALKNEKTKNVTRDFTEPEYTSIKKDCTINMAWHNVTNSTANSGLQQRLADSKGLTTIVPTWFHVKDTEGNLESIASTDYVLSLIHICAACCIISWKSDLAFSVP